MSTPRKWESDHRHEKPQRHLSAAMHYITIYRDHLLVPPLHCFVAAIYPEQTDTIQRRDNKYAWYFIGFRSSELNLT